MLYPAPKLGSERKGTTAQKMLPTGCAKPPPTLTLQVIFLSKNPHHFKAYAARELQAFEILLVITTEKS